MQRLEVSGAVRPIYESLGVKRLTKSKQLCWGIYRLEHNYIVRKYKISQLHVSALMDIFRLDTRIQPKKLYKTWYITYISVM